MLLETINLKIRKATDLDAEFLAEVQTNESVQKYTGGVLYSFENTLDHIKKHPESLKDFYIVELKETGDLIGIVAFVPNSHLSEEEILISLLPNYLGNGYGRETLSAFKEFWLTSRNVERMFVTVIPENKASVSILEKEGFVFVEGYEDSSSRLQHVYKYERNHT